MNRIAFMIILAIIGIIAAIGILRFISEPVPQQIVQPNEEVALPPEEMPVIREPETSVPVKAPENKAQVMPQTRPVTTQPDTTSDAPSERTYETRGN